MKMRSTTPDFTEKCGVLLPISMVSIGNKTRINELKTTIE